MDKPLHFFTSHPYQRAGKAAKGSDSGRVVRDDGLASKPRAQRLAAALAPRVVRPRRQREPTYGVDVVAALAFGWAVLGRRPVSGWPR